jgi:Zn ribbon nucleic-acid-binding protein
MAKIKVRRIHKAICPTCNGNGYLKIMKEDAEPHVHQCWDCDSEGEFFIYEPKMVSDNDAIDVARNTDKFLH